MPRRRWTAILVRLHRLGRCTLLAATLVFLVVSLMLSLFFYAFDRLEGPPYDTYINTLRSMLILVLSGFDVDPPKSAGDSPQSLWGDFGLPGRDRRLYLRVLSAGAKAAPCRHHVWRPEHGRNGTVPPSSPPGEDRWA